MAHDRRRDIPFLGIPFLGVPLLVALCAGALVGCNDDGGGVRDGGAGSGSGSVASGPGEVVGAGFGFGTADTVVVVEAREYRFRAEPVVAPGEKVLFHLQNGGEDAHQLQVVDGGGRVVGELPRTPAGLERALATELAPGDYVLRCRLPAPGGGTHESRGMRTTIQVT